MFIFRCLSLPDWFVEWLEDGENTPEDVVDFIGNFWKKKKNNFNSKLKFFKNKFKFLKFK